VCKCHNYIPPIGRTSTVYINFLLIFSKIGFYEPVLQLFTDKMRKKTYISHKNSSRSLSGPAHIRYAQQEGINEIVCEKSNNLISNIDSFSLTLSFFSFFDFALGYLQASGLVVINKSFYHIFSMKSKL